MRDIEIKIIDHSFPTTEKLMVGAARITQHSADISSMEDLETLLQKPYSESFARHLVDLPHPTLCKFGSITIAIVGASRRFLAQITRHQNEVKFMSGSLQYSNMSGKARFVTPYNLLDNPIKEEAYQSACSKCLAQYESFIASGINHDDAGYLLPQGMRNVLLISATPYQWRHMIHQRTCRRNSDETRYIMLRCWELLAEISPAMFGANCGAFCVTGECDEGSMSCGSPYPNGVTASDIIEVDFPLLYEKH